MLDKNKKSRKEKNSKKEIIYSKKWKKKLKEEIFDKEIKKGGKKLFWLANKSVSSNIA